MSIRAFQVNNGLVTPLADRTLYSFLTGGMVGVMGEGCSCTYVNINTVHISSGWGVIMGCLFQVTQEDLIIDYGAQTSFPVSCRVGIRLNVSAAGTEQILTQRYSMIFRMLVLVGMTLITAEAYTRLF